jgi:predicted ABC-type ATPase
MADGVRRAPSVIVLAGPNGAGKSTVAPALLRTNLDVRQFVNADVIAQGLAGFAPETVAMAAGRIVLRRLAELEAERVSFAFETTLSGRTFIPRFRSLIANGYHFTSCLHLALEYRYGCSPSCEPRAVGWP